MKRLVLVFVLASGCGGDDDDTPAADAPPADTTSACSPPTGAGTEHQGVIDADETWTYADSPHVLVDDVSVQGSTLTIEPCAVVRIRKGFSIVVGVTADAAALVAHGEAAAPITFERDGADEPWGSIVAFDTGTLSLEHVDLRGGGDPDTAQNNGGTLIVAGPGGNTGLTPNLRVVGVRVEGSGGYGVNVQTRAAFSADSTDLVIVGAGALPPIGNVDTRYPLYIDGPALASIPPGTYTGNAQDEIVVGGAGSLLDDSITFRARGVPYRLLTGFSMAPAQPGGVPSTLTIEAGVILRFPNGSPGNTWSMDLGMSNGPAPGDIWPVRLIAEGTAVAPIVLTSAEETPVAGDWAGIAWAGGPPDGNVMSYVTIEYAGGESGTAGFGCGPSDNDAALIISNWRPEDVFISDSTFSNSLGGGIVSGWSSDEPGPSLVEGNTFTNIGNGCNVSRWADGDGTCPTMPPICL